jgi:hypothetical protein
MAPQVRRVVWVLLTEEAVRPAEAEAESCCSDLAESRPFSVSLPQKMFREHELFGVHILT